MTVVLFNHFHAGDIVMSRTIIGEILAANPDTKFELQCRAKYAYLWNDLGAPLTSLAEGQERILRDGPAINLWFATFPDGLSLGLTYANQVCTYNRQAKKIGLAELLYDGKQRFVSLPRVEIPQVRPRSVLVENGPVLSGQPVYDINRHLKKLAKELLPTVFYCSGKVNERHQNIVDVSTWNLCQLSVLSERCSAIVSRLSATTVCSFTEANHGRKRLVFGQPLGCPIWDEAGLVYVPNDYLSLRRELYGMLR